MGTKIIKQGTTRSSNVRQVCFSENSAENIQATKPPLWPEISPVSDAIQKNAPVAPEFFKSDDDLARLEKSAYENGFAQGEKAGMEIAERKIEVVMKRYAESIMEVGRLRSALYAQVEREVVKLAIEVAKKIVHREIQADREIIETLVHVALSHVAEKSAVTVHLSPLDYNYLLEHRAELTQSEGRDISLLADQSIERGGCLIQTECGDIDARIEEKFREVEQAFFEGTK
jgi:flagellar assembly protein FliH